MIVLYMSEGIFIGVPVFVFYIQMTILPPTLIITTLIKYKGEVVIFHNFSLKPSICMSTFQETSAFVLVWFLFCFSLPLLVSEANFSSTKSNSCLRFIRLHSLLFFWQSRILLHEVESLPSLYFFILRATFGTRITNETPKFRGWALWRSQIPNNMRKQYLKARTISVNLPPCQ